MSFHEYKKVIEEGDTVIVYVNFAQTYAVKIKRGETHQTKFGAMRHDELIGKQFGIKFNCTKGYVYVLHPTPELWTQNLSHRTQILYTADISLIVSGLHLRPGSVVVEAGTGSGSLSHAMARTIAPTGHLHTFDFHQQRAQLAQEEFVSHQLGSVITAGHRDVCRDGFGLDDCVDAVFLDLPKPWEAVEFAKTSMSRYGGRFCAFSPCMEQTMRTCSTLRKSGFIRIETVESVLKIYKPVDVDYIKVTPKRLVNSINTDEEKVKETNGSCEEPPTKTAKLDKEEKVEKSEANQVEPNFLSFMAAPVTQPAHTGYLTFATLPAKGVATHNKDQLTSI